MNGFFINLIKRLDVNRNVPIEQTEEFKAVCNYYVELEPKYKLQFVEGLHKITLNDVLEQIYYHNTPLFEEIERRGKSEIVRLQKIMDEAKMLLFMFIKEVGMYAAIQ